MAEGDDANEEPTSERAVSGTVKRPGPESSPVKLHESSGGWKQRTLEAQYDVGEEIARGGMGKILVARDRELGRLVAVKVLAPSEGTISSGVVERFLLEAQVTAQLEHPNILPVYGVESVGGAPAFTMRLLGQKTLKSYLDECAKQTEAGEVDSEHRIEARLERFLGVCNAIAYAHARGVVHRDLKPSNVLLGRHHAVYVVDWGAAKVLGASEIDAAYEDVTEAGLVSSDAEVHTQAGELIGTPRYMAPEQAMGAVDEHGPAADQFALGMMLQEIVTLAAPRVGDKTTCIGKAVIGDREPMTVVPELAGLAAIVARATEAEMEDRYDNVLAFAADVRRWLRGDGRVAPKTSSEKLWARLGRRPARALAVLLAIIAAFAGTTAYGLWAMLKADRDAADTSRHMSIASGVVAERSAQIDHRLARVKAIVAGLAERMEERTSIRPTQPSQSAVEIENGIDPGEAEAGTDATDGDDLRWTALHDLGYGGMGRLAAALPLPDATDDAAFGMPVSFARAGLIWPEEVETRTAHAQVEQLGALTPMLRDAMLRAGPPAAGPVPGRDEDHSSALQLTYAAFETGVLVNYPAYATLPEGYDPRRRPWYRLQRDAFEPRFGPPYPDASGTGVLIPCNRAMHDAAGRFVGVAGADLPLEEVVALLDMSEALEGWKRTSLLDEDLHEIVDTARANPVFGIGLHDDAPVQATRVEAAVADSVRRGRAGWIEHGDEIVMHHRLTELAWTVVVRATPPGR